MKMQWKVFWRFSDFFRVVSQCVTSPRTPLASPDSAWEAISLPAVALSRWSVQRQEPRRVFCFAAPSTALFSVQGGDQVQQKCLGSKNDVLPSSSPSLPFLSISFFLPHSFLSTFLLFFTPPFSLPSFSLPFLSCTLCLPLLSSPHTVTAAWKHALE